MSLPTAMILSGIPPEQFTGELQGVLSQGSVLLRSPRSASASSTGSSTSSSSGPASASDGSSTLSAGPPATSAEPLAAPAAPSSSSATQVPSSSDTPENGLASFVSTETDRGLDFYLEVISQLEKRFQNLGAYPTVTPAAKKDIKIKYQNRDLLDLDSNLRSDWPFQYAVLPTGVENFFENRSQLSRVAGVEMLPHARIPCADRNCSWSEPVYY